MDIKLKGSPDKATVDFACQVEGCNRKIKTTVGAIRRSPILRCSAGHKNDVNGKPFDKQLRAIFK